MDFFQTKEIWLTQISLKPTTSLDQSLQPLRASPKLKQHPPKEPRIRLRQKQATSFHISKLNPVSLALQPLAPETKIQEHASWLIAIKMHLQELH